MQKQQVLEQIFDEMTLMAFNAIFIEPLLKLSHSSF
jgi:hypothetical protein